MQLPELQNWKNWIDSEENPLIGPEPPEWIIADPTFISPQNSPDKRWHLFAHGILYGIYHYVSRDGLKWKNTGKHIAHGIRPFLFKEDNIFYLLYEKTFTSFLSSIAIIQSSDLFQWSPPKIILSPKFIWEGKRSRRVGNPCLIKVNEKYRLYYSAASIFIWDALISEPKYIGVAEAKTIEGPYRKYSSPIISPSPKHPYRNLSSGALKILPYNGGWVGFNNGIYKDQLGQSRSSILLLYSDDGLHWQDVFKIPIIYPTTGWKKAFVYQLDVRKIRNAYWLYYNARSGWKRGVERIGLATFNN